MKLIDNSLKSFRVKGNLPQWVFWGIAIILFITTWIGVGIWARIAALRDLAEHEHQIDEYGVMYQETDYSCVPVSIVMLLYDQGIEATLMEVATAAGTDIFGTGPRGIKKAGSNFGFDVSRESSGFDEFISRGLPAIVIFRHDGIKHAAYIKPESVTGMLEVRDPVDGLRYLRKNDANDFFGSDVWDVYTFELVGR